jgi:hypothetical protein
MNQSTLKKIEEFSGITPSMRLAFNEAVDEWLTEVPPLTTLFSSIANSFIDEFSLLERDKAMQVFEAIEGMLRGDDEELNIGASTGFLETISAKPNFSKAAKDMLGERSRASLKEWEGFLGINDDEL